MNLNGISFTTNDAEYLFMSLFASHVCFSVHIFSPIIFWGAVILIVEL